MTSDAPITTENDDEPEVSLDELIDLLAEAYASADPGPGRSALAGELGWAILDRFERDGDDTALDDAVRYLDEAAGDHDSPRLADWRTLLADALRRRGLSRGDDDDLKRSLALQRALYEQTTTDDPRRDDAAYDFAETYLLRYEMQSSDPRLPAARQSALAARLATDVSSVAVSDRDPALAAAHRLIRGLAHLQPYWCDGDEAALDLGVALLSEALPRLSPDASWYARASIELCLALRRRFRIRRDPRDLDRLIEIGERAAGGTGADHPYWHMLQEVLASAYQVRWSQRETPADLERAVEHWQAALSDPPAEPESVAYLLYAELLRTRTARDRDRASLDTAIAALTRATARPDGSVEEAWLWRELALAHALRWTLFLERDGVASAMDCFERAVAGATPGTDDHLMTVAARILTVCQWLSSDAPDGGPEPALLKEHLRTGAAALDEAPDGATMGRPWLAFALAYGMTLLATNDDPFEADPSTIHSYLELARRRPDPPPGWLNTLESLEVLLLSLKEALQPEDLEPGEHVTRISRLVRAPGTRPALREALQEFLPLLNFSEGYRSGDRRSVSAARTFVAAKESEATASEPSLPDEDKIFHLLIRTLDHVLHQEAEAAAAAARESWHRLQALRRQHPDDHLLSPVIEMLTTITGALSNHAAGPDRPLPPGLEQALPPEPASATEALVHLVRLGVSSQHATRRGDVEALRRLADEVVARGSRFTDRPLVRLLTARVAGDIAYQIATLRPFDRAAADRAVYWHEQAVAAFGGEDRASPPIMRRLGEMLRRSTTPDRARSRRLGRAALRGRAWQVLIQAGTEHALAAATDAATEAAQVADWCLVDATTGDPRQRAEAYEDLVAAIDAGRGLMLQASAASRTVADRLAAAGHAELAAEWRATGGLGRDLLTGAPLAATVTPGEVPDQLRSRVLRALADAGAVDDVLGEVGTGAIRDGLTRLGADALVYLRPARAHRPGHAVIVPVAGVPEVLPLPELTVAPDSPLRRHRDVVAEPVRDIEPMGEKRRTRAEGDAVEALCRWAWTAAMADLVAYTRRWHLRRPARLVLVPLGELALVPWHAAFTGDGPARRYALADVVVSYAVSARMMCASARHPLLPARSALIVGDPTGDLPFAGVEARAIHRRFYADGAFLGSGTDGAPPATPDRVLEWMRTNETGACVVHFACHARLDLARPHEAHLTLAGGTLPALRMIEASRVTGLQLGRVFLAACTSNLAGADYDEAFSLATAFLAAGAHTVFGSLWRVPDEATSLLMYMVHHYLTDEGCAPVDALHRAQLWMVDPHRQPPPGMPAELAEAAANPDTAAPIAWAGFTHQGR